MNSEQLPIGKAHGRRRIAAARLWPEPVVWTDVRELMLLAFTQDAVLTWEVSRRLN
jgi:hypothetical protein